MNLEKGDTLGPYRVTEPIGAGGMGQVYRAHDARVGRDVAIKVASERFSDRFLREAQAIAALNHQNICHLYDVGPDYLVMELVEGVTLAERLQQGAIPLDDALAIARQIADALDAAHEKGIVHRDLKPGNVKIRPDGAVKVLDFGLAQTRGPAAQSDDSPTLATSATEAGVILGTAAYMAPEQAKGQSVDNRADVFAFGVVLYEMVTGRRLFQGETITEVLASVLKEEPQWGRVPARVQRLLRKCLQKDPQQRLRHIGDAMALVDEAPSGAADAPPSRKKWLWPAVAAAAIAAAALAVWSPWRGPAETQAVRFEIASSPEQVFFEGGFPMVSPDGRWVVFPATGKDGVTRMWLRSLDSVEVRPLAGTESGNSLPPPVFWSPDSRFVAFGSTPGPFVPGQLKKLDITGGPAQTITEVPAAVPRGSWNREGVILFGHNGSGAGLMRVAAAGGVATPATRLDATRAEVPHRWVQFLPDGRHFLYFRRSQNNPDFTGIYVGDIDLLPEKQSATPLLRTERQGAYAPPADGGPGHLLFLRDTTLFAQPFDPDRLELSGEPTPVADQVGSFAPADAGLFSVSDTGVLAYRVGEGGNRLQLTWLDRQGRTLSTVGDAATYQQPSVSPDGTRIAVSQLDNQGGNTNIWVLDLARGTSTRLTFNAGADTDPVWSPDGKVITFASNHGGSFDIYKKPADGSGEQSLVLKSEHDVWPTSWSRDGRFLLYGELDGGPDIGVLPLYGDGKPFPFLRTQFSETGAQLSPDGRWVAYVSDESGAAEVYVRPFSPEQPDNAAAGGKWMISKGGGGNLRWRNDGKELFFTQGGIRQMSVEINADQTFRPATPHRLFDFAGQLTASDIGSDGKRFLFAFSEGANAQTPFVVVLNWQAALKK